jgi:hypothetical protein
MATATPDLRAHQLDMFDAFCVRQVARIEKELASYSRKRSRELHLLHLEQPEEWQCRGHATGHRKRTLSELDGEQQ